MVEPVTMVIIAINIISLISSTVSFFKKFAGTESPSPAVPSVASQAYPPAILPSSINEDIPKIEYENVKRKKESLARFESDDHRSSSNLGSTTIVILTIAGVLATMAFLIYRKRNKLINEHRFTFHHNETPPSPPTTETDLNLTIV